MILNAGGFRRRILKAQTVHDMTHVQNPDGVNAKGVPDRRGLLWDIYAPDRGDQGVDALYAVGHTGYTGTAIRFYPEQGVYASHRAGQPRASRRQRQGRCRAPPDLERGRTSADERIYAGENESSKVPAMINEWDLSATNLHRIAQGCKYEVAVLPIGRDRAHNRHLPEGEDALDTTYIARRCCETAWPQCQSVICLPVIPFGVDCNLSEFPLIHVA